MDFLLLSRWKYGKNHPKNGQVAPLASHAVWQAICRKKRFKYQMLVLGEHFKTKNVEIRQLEQK